MYLESDAVRERKVSFAVARGDLRAAHAGLPATIGDPSPSCFDMGPEGVLLFKGLAFIYPFRISRSRKAFDQPSRTKDVLRACPLHLARGLVNTLLEMLLVILMNRL